MRYDSSGKKKRVLMLASVASMIDQFNMPNIKILHKLGYQVDVACNFKRGNTCSLERVVELKQKLEDMKVNCYQIDFTRSVMNLPMEWRAYKQVKQLVERTKYDFIHCHSPIGGVVGRIAAHMTGTEVIYTAHGFHFFARAPKKNWLLYYPVEKFFSRWTDVLITINKEDYRRAKQGFHAKKTVYIPGVGVDTGKFEICYVDSEKKRKELGLPKNGFVLLSVVELQERKNLRVVIEALQKLDNPNIYYLVVGQGVFLEEYKQLAKTCGLEDKVKILGPRTDLDELCEIADCFLYPSVSGSLEIALLEAMASGLPLISSYINGIEDYAEDGISGCCIKNPDSVNEMVQAIRKMYSDEKFRNMCGTKNLRTVKKIDIKNINGVTKKCCPQGIRHTMWLLERRNLRKSLGFSPKDFIIVSVGELNDNKNHKVIIEALAKIRDEGIKYIIIGKGLLEKRHRERIKALGLQKQVRLLGFQADVKPYLQMSDVFAFPSRREGLGLAAIEAMASGLPLITSNVHGINDYSVDGVTGYKCDSEDVDGFAKRIISMKEKWNIVRRREDMQVKMFDLFYVNQKMYEIYRMCGEGYEQS